MAESQRNRRIATVWGRMTRARRLVSPGMATGAYALYALAWTLAVGCAYYATLEHQLFLSMARQFARLDLLSTKTWSAPLDDVFIHFDFARSAARGYLFQWSEGNGYSSGGTSLLYPLVLAVGYRVGYQGPALMLWAGIVAATSTWAVLILCRHLFDGFSRWSWLVLPPTFFAVGALNWSLWSGMEVAFFLGIWSLCVSAWLAVLAGPHARDFRLRVGTLGAACFLLVATRPESAPIVACFVLTALTASWRKLDPKRRLALFLGGSIPGALVVVGQTWANKVFTGETSAAGALVKLEAHDPRLSASQVWDAWLFHLKYQILRVTNYHMSDSALELGNVELSYGWLLWVIAAVPLFHRATRRAACLLWCSSALWLFTVSFNGQVRWQNERYTMPAVAWLLIAAALGFAVSGRWLARSYVSARRRAMDGKPPVLAWARVMTVAALVCSSTILYAAHELPRQREQIWFFGRASRNIHDQHMLAGRLLTHTPARRVLLGDAGAIPYVSDLPAIDIIGLGGLHGYPFARATRLGLPAAIELISRMPPMERPNVMAIYPTWWAELPLWFGEKLFEVPVRGNVICGGASKVVYAADWTAMPAKDVPHSLNRREAVVAELDLADIVSEKEAGAVFSLVPPYVSMKILPHPKEPSRDLWDGGRPLPAGASVMWSVFGLTAHEPARIVVRVAPSGAGALELTAGGHRKTISYARTSEWQEYELLVPATAVRDGLPVAVTSSEGELIVYHVWVVQGS